MDVIAGATLVFVGVVEVVVVAMRTSEVEVDETASLADVQPDTTSTNDTAANPEKRIDMVIDALS